VEGDATANERAAEADRILRESDAILTGDHFVYSPVSMGMDGSTKGVPVNTQYAHGADFVAAQSG
jgi:hypothetical protein